MDIQDEIIALELEILREGWEQETNRLGAGHQEVGHWLGTCGIGTIL